MKDRITAALNALYNNPALVFVIIIIPFGLFSAYYVPQLSVTDENSHLLRAYQVSNGQVICHKQTTYPKDIVDKSATGSNAARAYAMDFSDYVDYSQQVTSRCGSAAGYSPLGYLPQAIGIKLAQLFSPTTAGMVLMARVVNLFAYAVIGYVILRKVKVAKYVFFVVLLIPQMVHLAASLSADMMNNITTLAFFAMILNLYLQKTTISVKQYAALALLVVLAALLKVSLLFMLLPLLFLPSRIFKKNISNKIPINWRKWITGGALIALAAVVYIVWTMASDSAVSIVEGAKNPIIERPNLFINLLFNTYLSDYGDLVLRGVIGDFSSFLYHFPAVLVFAQLLMVALALLYSAKDKLERGALARSRPLILAATATFVVSILAITYGLYTAWGLKRGITQYADGVQGRYFTALIVLLIPLFAWLRKYIKVQIKSDKLAFAIIVCGQLVLLCFYVLYTIRTVTHL